VDLSQDVDERPLKTRRGELNTLMHNVGVMYSPRHRRTFVAEEMMTAHGWPIDEASVAVTGVSTTFSRNRPRGCLTVPHARTRRSLVMQNGNGQHVNTVGGITLFCILKFPTLGDRDVNAVNCNKFNLRSASALPSPSMPARPSSIPPIASPDTFAKAFDRSCRRRTE